MAELRSPSLLALDLMSEHAAQHEPPPQEAPGILHKMGSLPKLRTPRAPLPPGLEASLLSPSDSPSAAPHPGLRSLLTSPTGSVTASSPHQVQSAPAAGMQPEASDSRAQMQPGTSAAEHSEVSIEAACMAADALPSTVWPDYHAACPGQAA